MGEGHLDTSYLQVVLGGFRKGTQKSDEVNGRRRENMHPSFPAALQELSQSVPKAGFFTLTENKQRLS